jgi:hypothetical protein
MDHTGIAKGIDHLIGLLLVIKVPRLLERTGGLSPGVGLVFSQAKIQAIEDKDACDTQVLECLQLSPNIAFKCKRKASECD